MQATSCLLLLKRGKKAMYSEDLNNIDSVADGVKGVFTGTPNFLVAHMLFADDHVQC